jgi:hypothetical protein
MCLNPSKPKQATATPAAAPAPPPPNPDILLGNTADGVKNRRRSFGTRPLQIPLNPTPPRTGLGI